ncbi:MAG: calcium-binding protein [Nannocystaceae bacterium]|nr:calcium-binding protein [Nannocystaceae bacterium]
MLDPVRTFALLSAVSLVAACDTKDEGMPRDEVADGVDDDSDASASNEDQSEDPDQTEDPDTTTPDPTSEPEDNTCTLAGEAEACQGDFDGRGTRFCDTIDDIQQWGECLEAVHCTPGESGDCGLCGEDEENCDFAGWSWTCDLNNGVPEQGEGCNTPLVLSFDNAPVQMQPAPASTFDINVAGGCISTDWPAAATPWLVLDRDKSGAIEDGRELFGSGTRMSTGGRARNGFDALAELDDNGDGRIDVRDAQFSELGLWGDYDGDKTSTLAEVDSLSDRRVLSIELSYETNAVCDGRGNCGVERASFTFIDRGGEVRQGTIIDIHLSCQ